MSVSTELTKKKGLRRDRAGEPGPAKASRAGSRKRSVSSPSPGGRKSALDTIFCRSKRRTKATASVLRVVQRSDQDAQKKKKQTKCWKFESAFDYSCLPALRELIPTPDCEPTLFDRNDQAALNQKRVVENATSVARWLMIEEEGSEGPSPSALCASRSSYHVPPYLCALTENGGLRFTTL